MPENDTALLMAAAREAGKIAQTFWQKSPKTWDKPQEAGPVTEADLAVNEYLFRSLMEARPDYGWLSEETDDTPERLGKRVSFIVDPIDGTRAFIAGERSWSHSIAVAVDGHVVAAAVYLPVDDKMYAASLGGGATLNDQTIRVSGTDWREGATVLTSKPNLAPALWPQGVPNVERHFRPSLAYRLSLVAQGRFDAMIALRPTWEWDVAAGDLITKEAGGLVTDRAGAAPIYNKPEPKLDGFVAGTPLVHQGLYSSLNPS